MSNSNDEEQILYQISSRIIDSGRDTRYDLGAYGFLMASLDYNRSKTESSGHIPARELVLALIELSVMRFGPTAFTTLETWGIYTPLDIGRIVYNLIDIEILSKSDDDSLDEFNKVEPFAELINPQDSYEINKDSLKNFIDS